jgi:hypothetical protein
MMNLPSLRPLVITGAAVLMLAQPALAGPPLLCFPFEIGTAASLPVGSGGWESIDRSYDAARLVDDTLALLTPNTSVIVRMETLRRATLYAASNQKQAAILLDRLQQRATIPDAHVALAVFDFGYLVETYKQATHLFGRPMQAVQNIDGYNLVAKSAAMTEDPGIDFALAVMTRDKTRGADVYRTHLAKVLKAAASNPAIEVNLTRQFGSDLATR